MLQLRQVLPLLLLLLSAARCLTKIAAATRACGAPLQTPPARAWLARLFDSVETIFMLRVNSNVAYIQSYIVIYLSTSLEKCVGALNT